MLTFYYGRTKRVVWPAFGCMQHPKAGRNTKQTGVFKVRGFYLGKTLSFGVIIIDVGLDLGWGEGTLQSRKSYHNTIWFKDSSGFVGGGDDIVGYLRELSTIIEIDCSWYCRFKILTILSTTWV